MLHCLTVQRHEQYNPSLLIPILKLCSPYYEGVINYEGVILGVIN